MSAQPVGGFDQHTADALTAARHLASIGVRLFVAEPNWTPGHNVGFYLPNAWEKVARADPAVVDEWRPGMALCAVGDGPISFIDLDPPQGGVLTQEQELQALYDGLAFGNLLPNSYGVARTPSGGVHLLVAGLDAPKTENVIPGVDVRAGRRDGTGAGFVFLAPTERSPKHDRGGPRLPYTWEALPYLDPAVLAADTTGHALSERLRQGRARERQSSSSTPPGAPQAYDSRSSALMAGALDGPRVMRTTEQAWADLEQARHGVLTCTDHAGAHEAVLYLAWQLARYTQGGLLSNTAAEAWYAAVLTERWGGPDEQDWLKWTGAWERLGREGPGDRVHLVTAVEMQQALQPTPQAPDNGGQIQAPQYPDWLEARIAEDQLRIVSRTEAQRRVKLGELADAGPSGTSLFELAQEPDEDADYRIDGLMPRGGNILLHAQFKAGKTTLLGNLVRALIDGDSFLGRQVTPLLAGYESVALLDFELPRRLVRKWLIDQRIDNQRMVHVESLRGAAHRFAITDPGVRARWATFFRSRGVRVLILDPLAPVMEALGIDENSNTEVGVFLNALTTLASESGIEELVVAHHAGHNGERARGASRFRGWNDAEWSLVRDEEAKDLSTADRFFSAVGRDVSMPESKLSYDTEARRLSVDGGNRRAVALDNAASQIRQYLLDNPGAGTRQIYDACHGSKTALADGLTKMLDQGLVRREAAGKGYAHYLNTPGLAVPFPSVPDRSSPFPEHRSPTPVGGDGLHTENPGCVPESGDRNQEPRTAPPDSGSGAQPHAPILTRERQSLMDRLGPPQPVGTPVDTPPVQPPLPGVTESDIPLAKPEPKKRAEPKPGTKAYERAQAKAAEKAERIRLAAGRAIRYPAVVQRGQPVLEVPLSAAETLLEGLPVLTVDVETSGVPVGHRDFRLKLIQLGCAEFAVCLDPTDPEQAQIAAHALQTAPQLRAHSSTADVVPTALAGLCDFDSMMARMDDTAIRAKLNDPKSTGSDAGLKKISDHMLGDESASTPADAARKELFAANGWVTDVEPDTAPERNGWMQVDPYCETFAQYGGSDVLDTALIGDRLPQLPPHIAERERIAAHMVARISHQGVPINGALVTDLMDVHTTKRAELGQYISTWYGVDNVGSGKQVAEALTGLGVRLPYTKPSIKFPDGQPSVAAGVLETLQGQLEIENPQHPALHLIEQVLAWRHHNTVITLFLTPYSVLTRDGDGRARPTVYTFGADTGRMSCVRPNFQQLPREGGIRAIITADPGMCFISADFSSVEIRVAAALSQDQALIRMLEEGLDPHGFAAELVFGPGYTKAQRYKVKSGVFGRIYGGGVSTLAEQMRVPIHVAQKLIDAIDTLWPTLSAWTKACTHAVERGLETTYTTYSGRVIHLPKHKAHAAGNYKIQGVAKELLTDGLIKWHATQWGNAIMWPVHDELDVMVPIAEAEAATAALVGCMESELYGVRIIADPSEPTTYWADSA